MAELGVFGRSGQVESSNLTVSERIRCLKKVISKSSVDAIIHRHDPDQRKCPKCPAPMMVWFVIALALFGDDSYRQVFKSLHRFARKMTPTRSALTLARAKLGIPVLAEWSIVFVTKRLQRRSTVACDWLPSMVSFWTYLIPKRTAGHLENQRTALRREPFLRFASWHSAKSVRTYFSISSQSRFAAVK